MSNQDVHEHDIVDEHDLDSEMVCKIIEKCNKPREGITPVAREVEDILDISETEAEDLVEAWRDPDWPIEYSKTFIVDDVDVYEDFMLNHRGYEPFFARDLDRIHATWMIDKTSDSWGTSQTEVELVEVNGVRFDE